MSAGSAAARAIAFARGNRSRYVAELQDFVRIPSVSGQPGHAADVRRCAEWLARELARIGLPRVTILPTARHPAVVAHGPAAPGRPTVLVYGHYDVQPAEPVGPWRNPPFRPIVRRNHLYGRGAADDKGQLFAHVKALEACLATGGPLPVNVTCLFEGEEEVGSPNLARLLREHEPRLRADAAAVSDTRMLGPDRPAITYGLRGSAAFELEIRGPSAELHSGNFGGAVPNPAQALCEVIARLHDSDGRIAVPGLYEAVRPLGRRERAELSRSAPSDADVMAAAGVARGWGERGYTLAERTTIRPALVVNGITGGYGGPGGKAIVPSSATAKLQLRLVSDQAPGEAEALVRRQIARLVPPGVSYTLRTSPGTPPVVVDRRHRVMRVASAAYSRAFGVRPAFVRSGGTIPAVSLLDRLYGIPVALMGFALPTSRIHAANERFHLPTFFRAIETCIWFYELSRALPRQPPVSAQPAGAAPRKARRENRPLAFTRPW